MKKIIQAYTFFSKKIEKELKLLEDVSDKSKYLNSLRSAITTMTFVNITSDSDEDSYTIFEILNARGVDLEDHELLKNFIIRYSCPQKQRDFAKTMWIEIEQRLPNNMDQFIWHYSIHKYGYQKGISNYKTIQQNTKKDEVLNLLNDLSLKSEFYQRFCAPSKDNCNEIELRVYDFFRKKRYRQMRPILLGLMNARHQGFLGVEEYNKYLEHIERFYILYNIIGEENSNRLSGVINKYAPMISNNFSDEIMKNLFGDLESKLPQSDQFDRIFQTLGWSHHHSFFEGSEKKSRVQTALETLERKQNNGFCYPSYTIEHIADDCESREHGSIGNLLLLEDNLQKRCNKKSFEEKCQIYSESNFKTTRSFASRNSKKDKFSIKDIESRTQHLSKFFLEELLNEQ